MDGMDGMDGHAWEVSERVGRRAPGSGGVDAISRTASRFPWRRERARLYACSTRVSAPRDVRWLALCGCCGHTNTTVRHATTDSMRMIK